MTKQIINTPDAPAPLANYSQGVNVGNTLYVQGMIAIEPTTGKLVDGGIEIQARRVFDSINAVLKKAGMGFEDVVKVTAFLRDLSDYKEFNKVYNSCFEPGSAPARTTVQAGLPMGALVEVEVIACSSG